MPPEVKDIANALLELSKREGLTRLKIRLPALLAVTNKKQPRCIDAGAGQGRGGPDPNSCQIDPQLARPRAGGRRHVQCG
jgi:hypothetical protein